MCQVVAALQPPNCIVVDEVRHGTRMAVTGQEVMAGWGMWLRAAVLHHMQQGHAWQRQGVHDIKWAACVLAHHAHKCDAQIPAITTRSP